MAYKISSIAGDGIGPEVIREALRALKAASQKHGFKYELADYPLGAAHYRKTGEIMSDRSFDAISRSDAILLGAIGSPEIQPGLLEYGIVGRLRKQLDLYVNLRPSRLYSEHLCPIKGKRCEDVDFVIVRENTEDAYAQISRVEREGTPDEVRIQEMIYTRGGTERIIRYAFELARQRGGKKKVTLCDKANAIAAQTIYRNVFAEVSKEYPDVAADAAYVDAVAMWLVTKPEQYDVIVTTNLFGDIISDLAAALQGGLGVAAGGNINPGKIAMFEPIHGSAPKYAGKNVASPIAAIMAVQMMLDYLGEKKAAADIESAVANVLRSGKIASLSADSGLRTDKVGDMVIAALAESRK